MDARQDLRQVAVALVGDDDRGAGLGDEEVGAGDADVGLRGSARAARARASSSSAAGSLRSRSGRQLGVDAAEVRLDLLLGQVHRRRDDVARRLVAELDDVFAEVGLDRLDAVRLEMLVEADLLGDHRLALGHGPRADPAADAEDEVAGVRRRLGVVHLAAGFPHLLLVGLEVEVEMGERVVLDVAGAVAQRLEFRQRLDRLRALAR